MEKKKRFLLYILCLLTLVGASTYTVGRTAGPDVRKWSDYHVGNILFEDNASQTLGSSLYHRFIPDAESYIAEQARIVLATLYDSPEDSIPAVYHLHYTLEDMPGVSSKEGSRGKIHICYSTRHIEKTFADNDTLRSLSEIKGVLQHELAHVYQLEPQGIGTYTGNRMFWTFIEGMADAVRIANGGCHPSTRPRGGNYMDGYRTAGYFFVWIRDNKDPDFLRKFNRTALEVIPWSFDGAIHHIFGEEYSIDDLWNEYQIAVGDRHII